MRHEYGRSISFDQHVRALVQAVSSEGHVDAGRLWGLPELPDDDVWVDIAGVAALTGVKPKTLTGWITRRGPKSRPFPPPFRLMYRLYWRRSSVEDWRNKFAENR